MNLAQAYNEQLAARLEGVLAGTETLHALLASPGLLFNALQPCLHGLQHYLADSDIRGRDADYRQMQEDEMRLLIYLLRQAADPATLSKVDFLSRTAP